MHFTKASKIIVAYFVLIAVWWFALYELDIKYTIHNYVYQLAFGFIPLAGGICGIFKSKKWGFLSSKVGRAVFFVAVGLISWGLGQMAWSFYNIVLAVEVPYPSWADAGYILAVPFWAVGIAYLSKATGAVFSLRKAHGKIFLFLFPLLASIASYYLLFVIARGGSIAFDEGMLKLFFDLAYPIGDVAILTLALLIYGLSFKYLGGKYKIPIITLIAGFVLMYLTDFTFSYVTTVGTYYNGHWVDLLFPTVMAVLSFGLNNLDPDLARESKNSNS